MHMPPDPKGQIILACLSSLHQELWKRLAPASWPLPLSLLPCGTALVGGAVRDGLLGRLGERPDLDLVVPGDGVALARQLAQELGGTVVELDRERAIGRLVLKGWTMDLARQEGGCLTADLSRRDYTVNAMALRLPIGQEALALVDPLHGLGDLQRRELRAIAEANLLDDPLRLLRGIRLAGELGFSLTEQTWEWIVRHRACLASVAGERVLAELLRLVGSVDGELLQRSGLLESWAPQPAGERQPCAVTAHLTLEQARLRGLTDEEAEAALPLARLSALLDEKALSSMHASNRLRRRCRQLRRWRQRLTSRGLPLRQRGFAGLPEAEQLELHRQLAEDLPALLLDLPVAVAEVALPRWRDAGDPLFHPRPPLDGQDLQKHLGLRPGPRLGLLLDHLTAARAFGRLPREDPSQETALKAAQDWLDATGGPCHD